MVTAMESAEDRTEKFRQETETCLPFSTTRGFPAAAVTCFWWI